jgi:anti-anti-sigma factor
VTLILESQTDREAGFHVLRVLGEVDIATIDQLEESIEALEPQGLALIVDLTATDFMDSSGLRMLLATKGKFEAAGRGFKVAVAGGPIARLLDVTGLLEHLEVYESVEEAASS